MPIFLQSSKQGRGRVRAAVDSKRLPKWYGVRYPSQGDLVSYTENMGCLVVVASIVTACVVLDEEYPAIMIPKSYGPLLFHWALAHELGHLSCHTGPRGALLYDKDEQAADDWAAKALLPEARIRYYRNASVDAFMGALSMHYEDLHFENYPSRTLAARIAEIRLRCLSNSLGKARPLVRFDDNPSSDDISGDLGSLMDGS